MYRQGHEMAVSKTSCNPFIQVLSENVSRVVRIGTLARLSCNPFIQVLSENVHRGWHDRPPQLRCNPFIQVLSENSRSRKPFENSPRSVVIPLFRSYRKILTEAFSTANGLMVVIPLFRSYRKICCERRKPPSTPEGCNPFIQVLSENSLLLNAIIRARTSCNPFIQVLSEN